MGGSGRRGRTGWVGRSGKARMAGEGESEMRYEYPPLIKLSPSEAAEQGMPGGGREEGRGKGGGGRSGGRGEAVAAGEELALTASLR